MSIIKKQDPDETDKPLHTVIATGDTKAIQYQLYMEIQKIRNEYKKTPRIRRTSPIFAFKFSIQTLETKYYVHILSPENQIFEIRNQLYTRSKEKLAERYIITVNNNILLAHESKQSEDK
jgi:hypothetical protein